MKRQTPEQRRRRAVHYRLTMALLHLAIPPSSTRWAIHHIQRAIGLLTGRPLRGSDREDGARGRHLMQKGAAKAQTEESARPRKGTGRR